MLPDVASFVEADGTIAAAFFDLDKTIISRSSALAFGPSFYRYGLITRADPSAPPPPSWCSGSPAPATAGWSASVLR
jgi:hypothetical protein